jgi:hypothetical protein
MSAAPPNELEERRVIRLLAGAAETITPLHDAELATLVRLARRPPQPRRRSTLRLPLVAAAVAASVLASLFPLGEHSPGGLSTSSSAGVAAHAPSFPAGSALSLLLARPANERA